MSASSSSSSSVPISTSMTTETTTTTAGGSSGTTIGGTGGGNDGGGISTTSSTLYLFTFLGTLLLLLSVSCAIVTRSFVLRRRFRRRMEEAIAAGLTLPQYNDKRRFIGEKPVIHEAWLSPGSNGRLKDIMPVSLQNLSSQKRVRLPRTTAALNNAPSLTDGTSRSFFGLTFGRNMSFGGPFHRQSRSHAPPHPSSLPSAAEDEGLPSAKMIQVAVMIAMPTPGKSHYPLYERTSSETTSMVEPSVKGKERRLEDDNDWEEEELPHVLMGVAQLARNSAKDASSVHAAVGGAADT